MAETRGVVLAVLVAGVLTAVPGRDVVAQSLVPGPPGPFVVDLRGLSQGLPADAGLHPGAPAGSTIPARGLGLGVGGHVYGLPLGLGIGVEGSLAEGSGTGAGLSLLTVSPFLSVNFGTSDGWSYLGAGAGVTRARPSTGSSLSVRSVVVGAGARWFPWRHVGVGFDLRLHRLAAGASEATMLPPSTVMSAAVGLSFK